MGYRARALGDGFCAPGDGGCALGAPLVWEQLNLDPALLLWVQHWEREYIAPIIGSDLKGSQAIPTCEPLRIKGRLFHAVLAEGQLQLPVPATLPKKSFPKKAPQTNTFWFTFL